ncbi:MAG: DPP IV N-terminal domain-containing protein, partial [Vicinamibacterales bacterium]
MPPRDPRRSVRMLILLLAVLAPAQPAFAQARAATAPPAPTADDYARAEKFLGPAVTPLVVGGSVSAAWLPDDRFTYRSTTAEGIQFLLVDPARATKAPAFDHVKLAAALGAAAGGTFDPKKLPFQTVELSADGTSVAFDVETRRWSCDVAGEACKDAGSAKGGRGGEEGGRGTSRGGGAGNAVTSPDGKRAVFIRDWNLWVRDVATGQEKALTTDGKENFGYATDNAGWRRSSRPVVLWSPDSRRVATFQQDERNVGDMYLVETKVGHPVLQQWKYPLPGDEHVAMLHRVIIDTDSGATVRLKMDPDYHRAMLG